MPFGKGILHLNPAFPGNASFTAAAQDAQTCSPGIVSGIALAESDMTMFGNEAGSLRDALGDRFKAFEATKLYDLLAATPLIVWYGFCLSHQVPATVQLIAETDLATADIRFFANVASKLATLVFFVVLVLLLALRHKPRGKSSGFYPRFAAVAGTYLRASIRITPGSIRRRPRSSVQ
jgi:hypothetical protein